MNMGLMKIGCLLLLCLFSVSAKEEGKSFNNVAKDATDIEAQPSTNLETQIKQKPVAKASKVSEFYIGDLLRTSDKELDTASTVYNPISSTPEYNNRALSPEDPRLFSNYRSHGVQNYASEEVLLPLMHPQMLQNPIKVADAAPLGAYERAGIQQPGVLGRNAMVPEAGIPALRRYEPSHGPHKGPDCKKHLHSSPASSEEVYASDERVSYQQGRTPLAPPPSYEYRNPGSYRDDSYEESPGYNSQSSPSSSKSYASEHDSDTNSNSKSGKSYTTSKSTSSSKTVNPNSKRGKVYVFDTRPAQQSHGTSSNHGSRSKSKSKSRPSHDSAEAPPTSHHHSTPEREPQSQYYETYDSETPSRPSHPSHAPSGYQKQHYSEQPHAENYERDNYRGSKAPQVTSYSKEGYSRPGAPSRERQPSIPPKYNSGENVREASPEPYRDPEEAYVADQPQHHRGGNRYYSSQRQPEAQYYQQEQPISSPRPGKGRPHAYDAYSPESAPVRSQSPYERNGPVSRPPVSKRPEYGYEAAPYSNGQSSENHPRSRKPSGRSERSSTDYYKPIQPEMRAQGPEVAAGPMSGALTNKEGFPQQSRSVSYSESSYNMGEPVSTRLKEAPVQPTKVQARMYEGPEKMVNPLLSRERDNGYEAPYHPYNSEHPGGYGGDRYQEEPHSGERDYKPQPYEKPHQPYEDYEDEEAGYNHDDGAKPKGEVVGYADKYENHEPLELDDDFFRKYEISKNAKIIVATAMNPNLFVADGTQVAEGGSSDDDESYERRSQDPKGDVEPEIVRPKQQLFEAPQEAPESFSQLVDTNPRFLRKLSKSKRPEIGEFEEYDPSLDELVFRSGVGDPKAVVKSKGAKGIVQHHGDGVSKIIFNSGGRQRSSASENNEAYLPKSEDQDEKLESAKSEKVEKVVEPEENQDRTV